MKKTISKSEFRDEFREYGRENQFSYEGLGALYDYICDYEDDCGTEVELDVVALCCEFSEYADMEEITGVYPDIGSIRKLYDHTQVIEFNGGIIIQDF